MTWVVRGVLVAGCLVLLTSDQKVLGPVVQSMVSLTSSLRVISLTVLHNILVFFAEKM